MKKFAAGLLLSTSLWGGETFAQTPQQCVTNAVAGGTSDAITVPLLPCGLSTNILILTITANNTTTTPTLKMAGYPAMPILTNTLASPGIGDFGTAGSVLMLTSTGSSWLIINGNVGGFIPLPLSVSNGGTGAVTLTGAVQGHGTSAMTAGTLPANVGGTGQTAYTDGQLLIGDSGSGGLDKGTLTAGNNVTITNGSGSITITSTGLASGCGTSPNPAGYILTSNGAGACTSNPDALFSLGNIFLGTSGSEAGAVVFSNATSGSIKLAPTTGILGNQTATFPANTGTVGELNLAQSWTAKQSFPGTTTGLALALVNGVEPATISATAATGTVNFDITTQSILYYTTNASASWTTNFRGNGSNTLNSLMATGDVVTVTFEVTQGGTAFFNNVVQVDGTTSGVTTKWQGGTAPSAGNINSIDVYTYAIEKTGSATFTVLASQTQFK